MLSVRYAECRYAEFSYAEFSYAECRYAECHYAECCTAEFHYAECRYAECFYAECHCAHGTTQFEKCLKMFECHRDTKLMTLSIKTQTINNLYIIFIVTVKM
jgi:hypothetical protein